MGGFFGFPAYITKGGRSDFVKEITPRSLTIEAVVFGDGTFQVKYADSAEHLSF
jgi:hypothetical protein